MPPFTLFRYLTWRMIFTILAMYVTLAGLIFIADFMENLRFAEKYADGSFGFALRITALRTPGLAQLLTPFIFLFGALWMFNQFNRRSELSVMRSAGMSIWRVIAPSALFAGLAGAFLISFLDPAATRMTGYSQFMKDDIRNKKTGLVRVFGDGIWLRHSDEEFTHIINAASLDENAKQLKDVTVWRLTDRSEFVERADAARAFLRDQQLQLKDANVKTATAALFLKSPDYTIPLNLTVEDFKAGTPLPESMSVWDLASYMRVADAAGLPTVRYRLRYHDLLSTPLKLIAMVMIAAMFSLRPSRSGGAFQMIAAGVGVGFFMYLIGEVSAAMGESGAVPVMLAAWSPAVIGALVATTGLLHLEEG